MTSTRLDRFPTLADVLAGLGDVAAGRVRLRPEGGPATEADLIAIGRRDLGIFELVDGVLVEKPMGMLESLLAGAILAILRAFVIPRNLGIVTGPDGMIRLAPGLHRAPDVAFIAWDRIPGGSLSEGALLGVVPDLAVEILSPSNTRAEMDRKRRDYSDAGVGLVWEVDPRARTVAVHEPGGGWTVLDESQSLDGGPILPGFALPLADLFGELDRRKA